MCAKSLFLSQTTDFFPRWAKFVMPSCVMLVLLVGAVSHGYMQSERLRTGAFHEWTEKHVLSINCTWDLANEKNLIAVSLSDDNSGESVVSLNLKTMVCSTSVNVSAKIDCEMDQHWDFVILRADMKSNAVRETATYDCKRIYFDGTTREKHSRFEVLKATENTHGLYVTEDSNDNGTPLVIALGVTVSLLVIVVIILSIVIMRTCHQKRKQFKSLSYWGGEGLHASISGQLDRAETPHRPWPVLELEPSLIELRYARRSRLTHPVLPNDLYEWHRPRRILNLPAIHDTVAIEENSRRSSDEGSNASYHSAQTLIDTTRSGCVPISRATVPLSGIM